MGNRKRYQGFGVLLIAAASVLTAACESKSACVKNGALVAIEGSHPHEMNIPTERIARAVGGTYSVKGEGDHSHVVQLTDADMAKLKAGFSVQTRTSSVNAHTHEVSISCKQ
jgi:hypothetical protein